jgi:hypothetical protein
MKAEVARRCTSISHYLGVCSRVTQCRQLRCAASFAAASANCSCSTDDWSCSWIYCTRCRRCGSGSLLSDYSCSQLRCCCSLQIRLQTEQVPIPPSDNMHVTRHYRALKQCKANFHCMHVKCKILNSLIHLLWAVTILLNWKLEIQ